MFSFLVGLGCAVAAVIGYRIVGILLQKWEDRRDMQVMVELVEQEKSWKE